MGVARLPGAPAPGAGFVAEPVGTHSSRTIMLAELSLLFANTCPDDSYDDLRRAAILHNVVRKPSAAGRRELFRRLRELYALDVDVPVYRALRALWDAYAAERPLLAMLCANARDPVLRASADVVLKLPRGERMTKQALEAYLEAEFPGRYSEGVLQGTVRRLLSSWTQSGHLSGHVVKTRAQAAAGPASTAYALFLGYLCGLRGESLFDTLWTRILDCSVSDTHAYAAEASARGIITYKRAGGIVDVDVSSLMPTAEGV